MGKLTHLMIHCADTPQGVWFDGKDIKSWHTDPKPKGRGWSKPGYSDIILLDGKVENLIDYDADDWVESWEISNGASGWSRRVMKYASSSVVTPSASCGSVPTGLKYPTRRPASCSPIPSASAVSDFPENESTDAM